MRRQPISPDSRIYNSRILDNYVKLLKLRYPFVGISELLSSVGIGQHQISDPAHWFTQDEVDLFYEKVRKVTGNPEIAREAGRYTISPDAMGTAKQALLYLAGPVKVYELIDKWMPKFTRAGITQSRPISTNKVEITASPFPGVNEKPFQCENRIGYFEAIPMAFGHHATNVDHPECIHSGGSVCRYIVYWEERLKSSAWKRFRNAAAAVMLLLCIPGIFVDPAFALQTLLPFSLALVFALSIYVKALEKRELLSAIDHFRENLETQQEKIASNYNSALVINEIGLALSKQTNESDMLSNVVKILQSRLDYDRGMILLANESKSDLTFRAGFGYTDEHLNYLKAANFHLNPKSKGVFVRAYYDKKPFLVNSVTDIAGSISARSLAFAQHMGTQSFICCPIVYEEESLGILAVDNVKSKRPLLESDQLLLMGIAPEIGVSLHNQYLTNARKQQFYSILKTLAASIDARDFLTAGHSEKVTEYSLGICEELGLSSEECEVIRVAALLHDYGKIGIADSILKKEGDLTPEEYETIKTHAQKTRDILLQIDFDGIYRNVPAIAGAHHERYDGSGYPDGLRGEEIPLGARIIAVADFVEAITSKRHYREPMSDASAIELLKAQRNRHFDSEVIDAFLRHTLKKSR